MLELFAQFSGLPVSDPPSGILSLSTLLLIFGVVMVMIVTYAFIRHGPRIAWSVAWGLAAVLMILLWVRSTKTYDHAQGQISSTKGVVVDSQIGGFKVQILNLPAMQFDSLPWGYRNVDYVFPLDDADGHKIKRVELLSFSGHYDIHTPY